MPTRPHATLKTWMMGSGWTAIILDHEGVGNSIQPSKNRIVKPKTCGDIFRTDEVYPLEKGIGLNVR